jgi:hypothetical protein
MFDCVDLPRAKHWDCHTEDDAKTRLMSLEPVMESVQSEPEELDFVQPHKKIGVKLEIGQPKHLKGKWIYEEHNIAMYDGYRCDQCGFFVTWDYKHRFIDFIKDYHWCPSCGADMRDT